MRIAALFILALGLGAGATIYFTAGDPEPSAYIIIGDTAQPYDPALSRSYRSQIERFGGKAALLFHDIDRWFASLWVGKRLGLTVICISVATAALFFWIARRSP